MIVVSIHSPSIYSSSKAKLKASLSKIVPSSSTTQISINPLQDPSLLIIDLIVTKNDPWLDISVVLLLSFFQFLLKSRG